MEFDHSSNQNLSLQPYNNSLIRGEMDDVFCTVSKDYLQDFHHLDLTFNNPHDNLLIETNGYDSLFDPILNEGNLSSLDHQDFNLNYEFKPFEQNSASGSTLVMKNFENSMDMHTSNDENLLSLCSEDMKPLSFVNVQDESSCITADNNYYDNKICRRKKNKKVSSKENILSPCMGKLGKGKKKSKSAKGQWTTEEDRLLIHLVEKFGVRKWSQIAQMLKGRIGKQCRERWYNHLRPDIKKDLWTEDEDRILIEAHAEVGNKWTEIAKRLPGRTENSIKNHWNATKRRQFSRRKCRTKWARPSCLLQNYIKSLNFEKSIRSSHDTTINAPKQEPFGNIPDYDLTSEVPEFAFDDKLFDENINMDALMDQIHDRCLDLEIPYDELPKLMQGDANKEPDSIDLISEI